MPLRMRWPSRKAAGSTPNESSMSTRSATPRARRAAALHGDAQVGALEGDHVVHAVADHGHVARRACAGRVVRASFCCGRDAAEDRALDGRRGELALVEAGELGARVSGRARPRGRPGWRARRHGARVVARDHLHLYAGRGELGEGLGDPGAQLVGEAHEAERHEVGGQFGRAAGGGRAAPPAAKRAGRFAPATSSTRRPCIGPGRRLGARRRGRPAGAGQAPRARPARAWTRAGRRGRRPGRSTCGPTRRPPRRRA